MIKRLILILIIGLSLACVPKRTDDGIFTITGGVEIEGELNGENAITDTLLDEALRCMSAGLTYYQGAGLQYIWFYHKYYTGDTFISCWKQIVNTHDIAGGGDTADFLTMSGSYTYEAPIGSLQEYDSILRERWSFGGYFIDSVTIWYCSQIDTVVLDNDETVTFEWTLTAANVGTGIQNALLYHLILGLATGFCEPIDSMRLFWRSPAETTTVVISKQYDFVTDTLILIGMDTVRGVDTLNKVQLLDESGDIMASYTLNGALGATAIPKVTYKIGVSEH